MNHDDKTAEEFDKAIASEIDKDANLPQKKYDVRAIAPYNAYMRGVCRGLRIFDMASIMAAAHLFAAALPRKAVVVPMPGHNGAAEVMHTIALIVASVRKDVIIHDCLYAEAHRSNYEQKKNGKRPEDFKTGMRDCPDCWPCDKIPKGSPVVIIDSCMASGVTVRSALRAFDGTDIEPSVLVLARGECIAL